MNISAAGAPAHRRIRARHRLTAVALGAGVLLGAADMASARPLADWVPPVPRSAPARADWAEVAELLPVSMVHERNALTGQDATTDGGRLVYVTSRVEPVIDSATQSYIARGRAAQANARVERIDAKDHPQYGSNGGARVERTDAKDHPQYGSNGGARIERMDAKDHPGYGGTNAEDRLVRRPVYVS